MPSTPTMIPTKMGIGIVQGAGCVYEPYTNFQEYFAITTESLSSPNAVRLSGLTFEGQVVQEGWQLRSLLAWCWPMG